MAFVDTEFTNSSLIKYNDQQRPSVTTPQSPIIVKKRMKSKPASQIRMRKDHRIIFSCQESTNDSVMRSQMFVPTFDYQNFTQSDETR